MGKARIVDNRERDFLQEMEEAKIITSMPMQYYVNRMGTQNEYTAAEVAGILGFRTTDQKADFPKAMSEEPYISDIVERIRF